MKKFVQEYAKVSRLKGLAVYTENDLYDFARLYLRIELARGTRKTVTGSTVSTSYVTIHGLCSKFDNLVGADPDRAEAVVKKAGVPLGACLTDDAES